MALNLTRTYTYSAGNTIASSENNTNENTLYNAFAGLEAGTSSMSKLPLDADPSSALHAATKQYVDAYANYRRPQLKYVSVTQVDVADNTGTSNQTKIIFPDGNYRSVTEDTSSTNKYRRFDITATAEFTSGTEDSGLRSGLSEANNTWYAIYAVKSAINTSNFVLAGDTTLPLTTNFSTLNSRYGTNGWVYLGLIRNGDNSGTAGDILFFNQSGSTTVLLNTLSTNAGTNGVGLRLATSASATSINWTYSAGTGTSDVPGNIAMGYVLGCTGNAAAQREKNLTANSVVLQRAETPSGRWYASAFTMITSGVELSSATTSVGLDIAIYGWIDSVLGVGSNPLI